jgi:hypothetical protein
MNGFNGGFENAQIVNFKNGQELDEGEDYYVYRSTEMSLGSIEVQVL